MALPAASLQRARGTLRLGFKRRDNGTVLGDLYQQGCLKARFPQRSPGDIGKPAEAVLINTAGGLTDGDVLSTSIEWARKTKATVTTQAAERVYRCRSDPALVTTHLIVADSAIGCWLPQETILFDGSRFDRRTEVHLAGNARFFAVESVVFGRASMGEHLRRGSLLDRWRVCVDGKLVFADAFRLDEGADDTLQTVLQRRSALGGARCAATLIWFDRDPENTVRPIKQAIESSVVTGGASNLGSLIVMRLLSDDMRKIRALILQIYAVCLASSSFAAPRVWSC